MSGICKKNEGSRNRDSNVVGSAKARGQEFPISSKVRLERSSRLFLSYIDQCLVAFVNDRGEIS